MSGALVPLPLRTTIVQQKTGRPVPFELTERTREALASWLHLRSLRAGEGLFRAEVVQAITSLHLSTVACWTAGSR